MSETEVVFIMKGNLTKGGGGRYTYFLEDGSSMSGDEIYIFHFDEAGRKAAQRQAGISSVNPKLSFNWGDASVVNYKIKQTLYADSEKEITQNTNRIFPRNKERGIG